MISFSFPKDLGPREWGSELLVAHSLAYTGKVIRMKAGKRGGLQYHRYKGESIYLVSGELLLQYDENTPTPEDDPKGLPWVPRLWERHLYPGSCAYIQPGTVHREIAITDCVIFEVSTPHFDDRVRMEEAYGEKEEGGLPTTGSVE